jgi:amino acid adenylation domain-containing protein
MNDILERIKQLSPEKRKLLEGKMAAAGIAMTVDKPPRAVEKMDYYTASPAQRRMYLIQQLDGGSSGYNMPWCRRLSGGLDARRLKEAVTALALRHESLRTSYRMRDGLIVAKVEEIETVPFEVAEAEDEARGLELARRFIVPFELKRAPLIRGLLIRISPVEHIFVLDMHHIVADGSSLGILIRDLALLYNDDAPLPPQLLHYRDYAAWQRQRVEAGELRKQLEFWRETLMGAPVLDMPLDFPRPAAQSFAGDRVMFHLPEAVRVGLSDLARSNGITFFMMLSALLAIVLAKYADQQDIVLGSPVAGRWRPELEGIVGMFVNTLAMRFFPRRELPVERFLRQVKETALRAFDHQEAPFEDVVEACEVQRDLSRNPLFNVMLVVQNMDVETGEMRGVEISGAGFSRQSAKFDLLLNAVRQPDGYFLVLEYCTDLFLPATAGRMTRHFAYLAEQIVASPRALIGDLSLATEEEKRQVLTAFNRNSDVEEETPSIARMFFEVCRANPGNMALVEGDRHLTYGALAGWVAMVASRLKQRGVGDESVVALLVERSLELVVGILGVLGAGGSVLAIDTTFPEQRIDFMLRDSGARLVLRREDIPAWDRTAAADDCGGGGRGRDLLYVIYTSGSTGWPKGVMLEQRHLVNLLNWQVGSAGLCFRRVAQFTTISFDVAFQEIFSTLLYGGGLLMLERETVKDVPLLLKVLNKWGVETAFFPASFLKLIFNHDELAAAMPRSIRHIVTAGEQVVVNQSMRRYLRGNGVWLHNHYGPSETHVVTAASFDPNEEIPPLPPIGKPVDNTLVYVLDPAGQVLPVGVPGELWIGGAQVGRGYLDRVELTAEKFAADPFSDGRLYRSGDLAKWLPDGALAFLGRMDGQVKIRGFRIEPGEIEQLLLDMADVRDAVVLARRDPKGEYYLCAYVATEASVEGLKRRLAAGLPEYMVPALFVVMETLPLTPNRKVDRLALPDPLAEGPPEENVVLPENAVQRSLAIMWSSILGVDPGGIGIDRSFFDLGGHSLRAAVLVARVERELRVSLPLSVVFQRPTIRGLAAVIEDLGGDSCVEGETGVLPVEKRDYYPVSPAQRRLFVAAGLDESGVAYNMPQRIVLEEAVDRERLLGALEVLAARHDVLRSFFCFVGGAVVSRVVDVVDIVDTVDVVGSVDSVDLVRPFDLERVFLWRVVLVGDSPVVFFDMHHLIGDNGAQGIVKKELIGLLRGEGLAPLGVGYVDYCVWLEGRDFGGKQAYWEEEFLGVDGGAGLPFDGGALDGDFEGFTVCFYWGELFDFATWLAVFGLVLARFCGQEEVTVGFPVSGRGLPELETMLGLFVEPVPLRVQAGGDMCWLDYVAEVRASVLKAMEHREGVPDGLLQGLSVMLNVVDRRAVADDRQLEAPPAGVHRKSPAKFPLSLIVYEGEERVRCAVEYRAELFRAATIDRLIGWWRHVLEQLPQLGNPRLREMEIVTESERRLLLEEFNDTECRFDREETLHEMIWAQAGRFPFSVAVSCGDEAIGYDVLFRRASGLASALRRYGVGPGGIVALSMERGIEMMVGILGILSAGGAYVWIDPQGPPERQQFAGRQSGALALVSLGGERGMAPCLAEVFGGRTVFLDGIQQPEYDDELVPPPAQAGDLAYVIYTSGTSGRPKGVMVEHGAAVNFVCAMERLFDGVDREDRCLSLTNLSFDVSVWEMFLPLAFGGRLVVLGYGRLLDPLALAEVLTREAVTMAYIPPGLLKEVALLLERQATVVGLSKLLVGVEPIEDTVLSYFLRLNGDMRIVNGYGPTETCVCSTAFVYGGGAYGEIVPIGGPLSNNRVVLLDRYSRLAPLGAVGELCVAGKNLARGYLDGPEATAGAFVGCEELNGERIYRTGDLARWLPEGNLRFLGRLDRQVKIRGYRVEPGEIAGRLLEREDVREAVVIDLRNKNGELFLAAYVAPVKKDEGEKGDLSPIELNAFLRGFLPDYMIPATYTFVPSIPLTPHGKVDRGRLPEPELEVETESTPPRTPLEEEMVALWAEVLGIDQNLIGMEADFFRLGGHSLNATVLAGRIFNRWQARVPLATLFSRPNPAALCRLVLDSVGGGAPELQPRERRDYYPLTPAQEGVFVKLRYEGASLAYNIPHWIPLGMMVEPERVERAINMLIRRHPSLRTAFCQVEGQPAQRVLEDVDFYLEDGEVESFVRPFDISRPPLLRAMILRRGDHDWLYLDVHHLLSDCVSQ